VAIRPGSKDTVEKSACAEQTDVPFVQRRQRTSTENYPAGMSYALSLERRRGLGQGVLNLVEGKAPEFELGWRARWKRINLFSAVERSLATATAAK
jgi:hypothetical protein